MAIQAYYFKVSIWPFSFKIKLSTSLHVSYASISENSQNRS
jgi:hypothetical protein